MLTSRVGNVGVKARPGFAPDCAERARKKLNKLDPPPRGARAAYPAPMPTKRDPRLISLGYGRFVRADRVFALVPLPPAERGDGRRTYVHVDGIAEPLVASRSERAILADVEAALAEAAGVPRRRGSGRPRARTRCSSPAHPAGLRIASGISRSVRSW